MTHAAATIPLTFDGVDIQFSDLGIFLEIIEGLNDVPEVRGKDVVVPAADGQEFRNRRADRRRILLAGIVRGSGADVATQQADYRNNVQTLQALFDPTADPAILEATLEDGTIQTINARTVGNGLVIEEVRRLPSLFATVTVTLDSVDPHWVAGS